MPLETRLTPEQRDRVLDLAARLQAQHDGTVAVDDLARAAAEAGIEPRFVHAAAHSVMAAPGPKTAPGHSVDRTTALALVAALSVMNAVIALTPLARLASTVTCLWFFALAGVAGYWSAKGRVPAWVTPLVVLATLLGVRTFFNVVDPIRNYAMSAVTVLLLMEALIATVVGLVSRAVLSHRAAKAAFTSARDATIGSLGS